MNHKDHQQFYEFVKNYVSKNPECAAYVQNYVAAGISSALEKEREICRNWELGLFAMLKKRFPNRGNTVNCILQKNKESAWMNWDWYFLEKK